MGQETAAEPRPVTKVIEELEDEVSYLRQQLAHAESLCEAPKAEQLRATALSFAISYEASKPNPSPFTSFVVGIAEDFEKFLRGE